MYIKFVWIGNLADDSAQAVKHSEFESMRTDEFMERGSNVYQDGS